VGVVESGTRRIEGRGGRFYALGDSFRFRCSLRDGGDGWDWVVPDVRRLDPDSVSCRLWQDEWVDLEMAELFPRSGRIRFNRCLRGEWIEASGIGRPAALLGEAERWALLMDVTVSGRSVLGSGDVHTTAKTTSSVALVETTATVFGVVLVELPFARAGHYTGVGNTLRTPTGVKITFDTEGVLYEPA